MNALKLLMLGVWVCAVTLVSGHFALTWRAAAAPETETPLLEGIDYEETEILHVPVLADGQVQGYVAAQFVFTADARALRQMTVKPHPYVRDEALRTIYSNTKVDFTKLERIDIDGLLKTIRTNVNTRFGGEFIKEFNYVRKEQLRS